MSTPDSERDAWLSQALRHAPDAAADAPPALSEAILREARSAAARPAAGAPGTTSAPRRARRARWWLSAWDWLARPPVAAGFAGVMVATVVGMMWWDRPLDPTLPHPPNTISAQPPARIEAAPAVPAPRDVEQADAAPSPAPAPAPAPAPMPQAEVATNEQAPARRRALAAPAAKTTAESPAAATTDKSAPHREALRAAPGGAGSPRAKAQASSVMASPLAGLLASVAQAPERWRWQRGSADPKPMTPELERWLKQLDIDTAARWRQAAQRAPHDRAGALSLWRDGVLQVTLGFAPAAVWVETSRALAPEPTPASALAALPASSLEALRKALDDATP